MTVAAALCLLCSENSLAQTRTCVDQESGLELLEMPAMPDSLRLPSDRAAYLLLHFWDNMDFTDRQHARDEAFMVQNFVNFLSVMPIAGPQAITAAVDNLYRSAASDPVVQEMLDNMAEDYLNGNGSPMRNEEIFIAYLDGRLAQTSPDNAVRQRLEYQKAMLMLNRPGTVAADFRIEDRKGRELQLSEAVTSSDKPTLLVFYDPDCEDCHVALWELSHGEQFDRLNVVAVYPDDDAERWLEDAAAMPEKWTVARAKDSIEEDGLYDIPATPTIYLIDKDMKVILKNAVLEQVEDMLNKSV